MLIALKHGGVAIAALLLLVSLSDVMVRGQMTSTTNVETTVAGMPVDNIRDSLTVGPNGPVLIQDAWTLERLQIQNRERLPERTVHARGALAKGNFICTNAEFTTQYTIADFLNETNKVTPMAVRFSTVIHSKGSPEFLRDPRGFAIKFYTQQGNYDIVGLDFPVFFIRDGRRFPDMIRSLKPNPVTDNVEWWRIWDFFSAYPESTHMWTWLLDDAGIPANYRQLPGWGVHTYVWINSTGNANYVRYTYETQQGVAYLSDAEAPTMAFNFATLDLYDNIANGTFPSWTVYVQVLDPATAANVLGYDPLDTTKYWDPTVVPLVEIGNFTLNQNVDDYFLENEQAAFAPSRMIPGVEPSAERMLQWRLYSYPDAQRYRLGVNNQMLPVNAPRCPFMNNHQNGKMNFKSPEPAQPINYFPSTISGQVLANPYPHDPLEVLEGQKVRVDIDDTDDFAQAGQRYNSFDPARQQRLAQRIAATLIGPEMTETLLDIWMGYWNEVSPNLAASIKGYMLAALEHPEADIRDVQLMKKVVHDFFRASGSRP